MVKPGSFNGFRRSNIFRVSKMQDPVSCMKTIIGCLNGRYLYLWTSEEFRLDNFVEHSSCGEKGCPVGNPHPAT